MKKIIFIKIFLFIQSLLYAQRIDHNKQLHKINKKDILHLVRIDNHVFYTINSAYTSIKNIFLDDKALDSTGLNIYFPLVINNNIYFTSYERAKLPSTDYLCKIHRITLLGKMEDVITLSNYSATGLKHFYYSEGKNNDSIIYKLNSSWNREILIDVVPDMNTLFPGETFYDAFYKKGFASLVNIAYINSNKFLLAFADCSADCFGFIYIIYDSYQKKYIPIQWINNLIVEDEKYVKKKKYDTAVSSGMLEIIMNDLTEKYVYGYLENYEVKKFKDDYVFNENLDTVSRALKKVSYSKNYNYDQGKITSVMLRSILDNKTELFVPYKFTLPLERSFYRIYTDQSILEEDQKEFGEYEWSLLKNFIYAKYNYQFESEFYQAYFNVFEFYRAGIGKRKKNVEGKFTKVDKANLKLILEKIK